MRLLIVEDEKSIGQQIVGYFTDMGYSCRWVKNCRAAQEELSIEEFDCIILDRRLPDGDSISVCREVRGREVQTPIIMLTALSDVDERIKGLDSGADDYLVKPFSTDELAARVNALIRRNSYKNTPVLSIGEIKLDSVNREVSINSSIVTLSNREFLLLEYLMRMAGKPLTRIQILENVWDMNIDSNTNIVDVYINYVRNKIDKGTSQSHIETVRGYGYKFKNIS